MSLNTEFNDNQFKSIYDESMRFHYWNLYRNDFIIKFLKSKNIDNILDIGCGRGLVSDFIYKRGLKIQGVELGDSTPLSNSSVSIQYKKNALELDPNLNIKSITLFDVIEHIEKPITFLNQLISHFYSLENIVLTVPSRMEIWSIFDEFNGHYKRYHLTELNSDFKDCHATIVESRYFFHSLYWLMLLNAKFFGNKRVVNYSRKKEMSSIEKLIHRVISFVFKILDFIFPKYSRGSSIIIHLKVNR